MDQPAIPSATFQIGRSAIRWLLSLISTWLTKRFFPFNKEDVIPQDIRDCHFQLLENVERYIASVQLSVRNRTDYNIFLTNCEVQFGIQGHSLQTCTKTLWESLPVKKTTHISVTQHLLHSEIAWLKQKYGESRQQTAQVYVTLYGYTRIEPVRIDLRFREISASINLTRNQ